MVQYGRALLGDQRKIKRPRQNRTENIISSYKVIAIIIFLLACTAIMFNLAAVDFGLVIQNIKSASADTAAIFPTRTNTLRDNNIDHEMQDDQAHMIPAYLQRVWLAGIIRDASNDIRLEVMQYFVELTCELKMSVHIVANTGIEQCLQTYHTMVENYFVKDKKDDSELHGGHAATLPQHANSRRKLTDFLVTRSRNCGSFIVVQEPENVSKVEMRIDKIAIVRDYQRNLLRSIYQNDNPGGMLENDFIIIADVDLFSLPPTSVLCKQIRLLRLGRRGNRQGNVTANIPTTEITENTGRQAKKRNDDIVGETYDNNYPLYDGICSAGVMHRPYGYYDIFATVLLPDTFVYPIRGRLIRKIHKIEDATLIRSDNVYGQFTQWDLLTHLEKEGKALSFVEGEPKNDLVLHGENSKNSNRVSTKSEGLSSPVPVRSCFGGLTIYRAHTWFDEQCLYQMDVSKHLLKYASRTSKRPCEHVVFHDCLHRRSSSSAHNSSDGMFLLAIQPGMRTEWDQRKTLGNRLYPGSRHETLMTLARHKTDGDRLINGDFTLTINEHGVLVVQRWKDGLSPETIWEAPKLVKKNLTYWTQSALEFTGSGDLVLIMQVPMSRLMKEDPTLCSTFSKLCDCDKRIDNCKLYMWTTESSLSASSSKNSSSYALDLDASGNLAILDAKTNAVLWIAQKSVEDHSNT